MPTTLSPNEFESIKESIRFGRIKPSTGDAYIMSGVTYTWPFDVSPNQIDTTVIPKSPNATLADVAKLSISMPISVFKDALDRVIAGTADATILCVGDSETAGAWALGTTWGNAKSASWPIRLAGLLAQKYSVSVSTDAIFGDAGSTSNLPSYDPKITLSGAWQSVGVVAWGGLTFGNTTSNTDSMFYQPSNDYDTVTLFYVQNTGYGGFQIYKNGVKCGGDISAVGALSVVKLVVTVPAGTAPLEIRKMTGATPVYILGWYLSSSTSKRLIVINAGWSGSKSGDWAANTNVWDPLFIFSRIAPNLSIVALGVNDAGAAVTGPTYTTNLNTIFSQTSRVGNTLFISPIPAANGSISDANQLVIAQACRAFAQANGVNLVDINSAWGYYTTAVAAGYYQPGNDPVHPGNGYIDIAKRLAAYI